MSRYIEKLAKFKKEKTIRIKDIDKYFEKLRKR